MPRDTDIDLVILDLVLPDSVGSAGYLELHKAAPDVPIVVLTGSTCMEVEFAVLASGADDYLDKSVTSGPQLLNTIKVILRAAEFRKHKKLQSFDGRLRSVSNSFLGM